MPLASVQSVKAGRHARQHGAMELYKGFAMLQSGLDLGPVLTHEFHIDDFAQGFATMASGKSGKVILNWE